MVRKQIGAIISSADHNQMKGLIKLESKTNDMALELEYSKRQSHELITKLRCNVEGSKNLTELLVNEVALNTYNSIEQRNELLMLISDEKQSNDIVYNKIVEFVKTNLINLYK